MRAWLIGQGAPAPAAGAGPVQLPPGSFLWMDFVREDGPDLQGEVLRMAGVALNPEHVEDTLSDQTPSFFDGTDAYDVVILREPVEESKDWLPETRPLAVVVTESLIVTVRSSRGKGADRVLARLQRAGARQPNRPAGLLWRLFADAIDGYMALRAPVNAQLEAWQDALLDPDDPFEDWMELVRRRRQLRLFQTVVERGEEALGNWREDPFVRFDETLEVRVHDLIEHLGRASTVLSHAEAEINSFIQLHFAATTHRSNEIMKILTVVSAVFLPLNLVAGIFGMNFERIPGAGLHHGFWIAVGGISAFGIVMLFYFRRQKWF